MRCLVVRGPRGRMQAVGDRDGHELIAARVELNLVDAVAVPVVCAEDGRDLVGQAHSRACSSLLAHPARPSRSHRVDRRSRDRVDQGSVVVKVFVDQRWRLVDDSVRTHAHGNPDTCGSAIMSKIPADSTDMELADDALCAALTAWLPGRRWYAGKGHDVVDSRILSRYRMDRFDHVVLGVELDGQGWQRLPGSGGGPGCVCSGARHRNDRAGPARGRAVNDGACVAALLEATGASPQLDPGQHRHGLRPNGEPARWDWTSFRLLDVEQSNTSVVFDDRALVKVLRRLNPGINPGGSALAVCPRPVVRMWRRSSDGSTAAGTIPTKGTWFTDIWQSSRSSIGRRRRRSSGVPGAERDDDFIDAPRNRTGHRPCVHADLAKSFPQTSISGGTSRTPHGRITRAARAVPEIVPMLADLLKQLEVMRRNDQVDVQRVHGTYTSDGCCGHRTDGGCAISRANRGQSRGPAPARPSDARRGGRCGHLPISRGLPRATRLLRPGGAVTSRRI